MSPSSETIASDTTAACLCESGPCCFDCKFKPSTVMCNAAAHACDADDYCSGSSAECVDAAVASGGECNTNFTMSTLAQISGNTYTDGTAAAVENSTAMTTTAFDVGHTECARCVCDASGVPTCAPPTLASGVLILAPEMAVPDWGIALIVIGILIVLAVLVVLVVARVRHTRKTNERREMFIAGATPISAPHRKAVNVEWLPETARLSEIQMVPGSLPAVARPRGETNQYVEMPTLSNVAQVDAPAGPRNQYVQTPSPEHVPSLAPPPVRPTPPPPTIQPMMFAPPLSMRGSPAHGGSVAAPPPPLTLRPAPPLISHRPSLPPPPTAPMPRAPMSLRPQQQPWAPPGPPAPVVIAPPTGGRRPPANYHQAGGGMPPPPPPIGGAMPAGVIPMRR